MLARKGTEDSKGDGDGAASSTAEATSADTGTAANTNGTADVNATEKAVVVGRYTRDLPRTSCHGRTPAREQRPSELFSRSGDGGRAADLPP